MDWCTNKDITTTLCVCVCYLFSVLAVCTWAWFVDTLCYWSTNSTKTEREDPRGPHHTSTHTNTHSEWKHDEREIFLVFLQLRHSPYCGRVCTPSHDLWPWRVSEAPPTDPRPTSAVRRRCQMKTRRELHLSHPPPPPSKHNSHITHTHTLHTHAQITHTHLASAWNTLQLESHGGWPLQEPCGDTTHKSLG